MAKMIPSEPDKFTESVGEIKAFDVLKSLPDRYFVFHSLHWNTMQKDLANKKVIWGESDFTIYDPLRGLLFIEVKNGGISRLDGKWYQTNTITQVTKELQDPMDQADRSKHTIRRILGGDDDYPDTMSFPYKCPYCMSAVWFTSIPNVESIGPLPLNYKKELVLTQKDLNPKVIEQSLNQIFDAYGCKKRTYISDDEIKWLIDTLSPNFSVFPSLSTKINDQNAQFHRMTLEQSTLLDYLEEQREAAIQGSAGTGKTWIALQKAIRLSANLPEGKKVLFLCYNNFLLTFLRNNYAQDYPNIDFYNLQGLVCKNTGRSDAGGDEGISRFLNEFNPNDWPYKHIIIDEGQDFYPEHISLLASIAEMEDGCFYVFFDKNQLVQRKEDITWLNDMDCRLVLSANCRNTRSIAETSGRPIGVSKIKMRRDVPGQKPNLYIEKDKPEAWDRIAEIIRRYTDEGIERKDIVILTVKTEDTSILSTTTAVGHYHLAHNLDEKGILFTTARKYKGLESIVTIVVDLDEKTFQTEEGKRLFYVGASRGKHFLEIVSILDNKKIEELATQLAGKKPANPNLALMTYLKVKPVEGKK